MPWYKCRSGLRLQTLTYPICKVPGGIPCSAQLAEQSRMSHVRENVSADQLGSAQKLLDHEKEARQHAQEGLARLHTECWQHKEARDDLQTRLAVCTPLNSPAATVLRPVQVIADTAASIKAVALIAGRPVSCQLHAASAWQTRGGMHDTGVSDGPTTADRCLPGGQDRQQKSGPGMLRSSCSVELQGRCQTSHRCAASKCTAVAHALCLSDIRLPRGEACRTRLRSDATVLPHA